MAPGTNDGATLVAISVSAFGEVDAQPRALLEKAGVQVLENPHGRRLSEDEVLDLVRDADGVIAGTEPLTENTFAQATRLRVIARVGAGTDNVDLEAAERRGIAVRTTPDAVTDAAAELTLAGMLAVLRRLPRMDEALRGGIWDRQMGRLLGERTVGIVGFGRVGRRVAELVRPFGARMLASDVAPNEAVAAELAVELVALDELLDEADVVTLHCPGQATPVLDRSRIEALGSDAIVVNAARGGLIDEEALAEALDSGALAGAYLDVFAEEPYDGPLLGAANVVVTPHAGSYAREARARMEMGAVTQLLNELDLETAQ